MYSKAKDYKKNVKDYKNNKLQKKMAKEKKMLNLNNI